MLEMNSVTKTFGTFKALDNLTLTVPQGAVYGLVGPNGAGKSTAIRHLTGVYRPDSGTVQVDGQPVYENPAVKSDIGYIPDEIFFFPSATMEDMRRFYKGLYPDLTKTCTAGCTTSSGFPRTGRFAGSARVCRSRRPSIWPWPCVPRY